MFFVFFWFFSNPFSLCFLWENECGFPGLPFLIGLVFPEVIHSKFVVREDSGVKEPVGPSLLAAGLDCHGPWVECGAGRFLVPLSLALGPHVVGSHPLREGGLERKEQFHCLLRRLITVSLWTEEMLGKTFSLPSWHAPSVAAETLRTALLNYPSPPPAAPYHHSPRVVTVVHYQWFPDITRGSHWSRWVATPVFTILSCTLARSLWFSAQPP